ncbi:hypothetical protein [Pleionea sp. CnH1-48]|uniref:hypothetical protein n=1 Tax=Pleionea sp. CnH1-48 TaxID=2954494 RepID=UPI002096938B|nr:hypothetical protein [Pleionea sp. CnH1-48]MCO7226626.1 hypothetical protein [Pleionea sp. CnH1-48]
MVSLKGIFNTDANYPGIQIKVELSVIQKYLSLIETGVSSVCNKYLREEESKIDGLEYSEFSHIYQIAEDEIPRLIRTPYIVTIYTLFENSVTQLLNYAQERECKSLGLKDINGKSLQSKFNKYMAHIVLYEFEFNNNE